MTLKITAYLPFPLLKNDTEPYITPEKAYLVAYEKGSGKWIAKVDNFNVEITK
jgi:hypothetical protein